MTTLDLNVTRSASTVSDIVAQTRNTGNTSWILKAAINSPNCIIVAKDIQQVKRLQHEYFYLLSREPLYKRRFWSIFGRTNPTFMHINSGFHGLRVPIILDNCALL